MHFAEIANRMVTITLRPEECRQLALACKAMSSMFGEDDDPIYDQLPSDEQQRALAHQLYTAWGAAFEHAALAGVLPSYHDRLGEQFTLSNLRAGNVGDRLWNCSSTVDSKGKVR